MPGARRWKSPSGRTASRQAKEGVRQQAQRTMRPHRRIYERVRPARSKAAEAEAEEIRDAGIEQLIIDDRAH